MIVPLMYQYSSLLDSSLYNTGHLQGQTIPPILKEWKKYVYTIGEACAEKLFVSLLHSHLHGPKRFDHQLNDIRCLRSSYPANVPAGTKIHAWLNVFEDIFITLHRSP